MKNKNNKSNIKVLNLGNNSNIKNNNNKDSKKNIIESYNTKINNKYYNLDKKINLEISSISEKNNNLSLFSYLSNYTNQEDKLTNKSLRTTKETEGNQINNKNKIFSERKKIKMDYKNRVKIKQKSRDKNNNTYNNININKELDKFKIRIDNLLKIIEKFENNYINSEKPKMIKEEFNKIIKDKKYFQMNNQNNNIKILNNTKSNVNINKNKEKIQHHKINYASNSVNNINTKIQKKLLYNRKEKNINKNKRIKHCLLSIENIKKNVKVKTNRKIKEKEIKDYKNVKTKYCTFKSIEIREKPNLEIKTKHKEKNVRIKNIYTNSNFKKTGKINKIKGKVNK